MPTGLFFNLPSPGHINPTLPVVDALVRKGHRIAYYLTDPFRQLVESVGAEFRSYGESYAYIHPEAHGNPLRLADILAGSTEAILESCLADVQALAPNYVVYDAMCPWGRHVGELLGIPQVSSFSMFSFNGSSVFANLRLDRTTLRQTREGASAFMRYRRTVRRLRRKFGLGPIRFLDAFSSKGQINLIYSSLDFHPYASTLDDSFRFVGPALGKRTEPPFDLSRLPRTRPLVYVSTQTALHDFRYFHPLCAEGLQHTDATVLVSAGLSSNLEEFETIPENFIVERFLPQLQILDHADVFITAGGLSSVVEALYFAVPLIVIPQSIDHEIVGKRVQEVGAGIVLSHERLTAERLRETVDKVLGTQELSLKAARMSDSLRRAGGAESAALEISKLIGESTS